MANSTPPIAPNDIETYVEHGYADNNGVKIHYASLGSGPLIVMIHGFPDYWYTWRNQMVALAPHYQTVALDLRGYNLSDKPKGAENYAMTHLVADVQAVIGHEKRLTTRGDEIGGRGAHRVGIEVLHEDRRRQPAPFQAFERERGPGRAGRRASAKERQGKPRLARAAPRTKVVFPVPRSPERPTTSPGRNCAARRAASASVSSGEPVTVSMQGG